MVFISHKLREVMEICDRYTVLRDGVMVSSGFVRDTTIAAIARDMVGHEVRTEPLNRHAQLGEEVLRLENMALAPYYKNVSLSVRAGEVLGVTGLLGDGRSELFRTVFGDMGRYEGRIYLHGKPVVIPLHAAGAESGRGLSAAQPQGERHRQGYGHPRKRHDRHLAAAGAPGADRSQSAAGRVQPAAREAAHPHGKADGFDQQPLRRQPAEGRSRQVALRKTGAAHPRQSHAGRGRGRRRKKYTASSCAWRKRAWP